MAASSRHNGFYYDHANDELQVLFNGSELMAFNATGMSMHGAAPVAQGSAPTAADGGTVDATYGQPEADVISNLVTRQAEIIAVLQNAGLMAS